MTQIIYMFIKKLEVKNLNLYKDHDQDLNQIQIQIDPLQEG
jgi:hypothetical protein